MFGLFLDLVEMLGWRVSAICQLWASDLDRTTSFTASHGRIRKREEVNKEGFEMRVPMSESARRAVNPLLERAHRDSSLRWQGGSDRRRDQADNIGGV